MSHGGLPTTAWMALYSALAGGLGGILLALLWTPLLASNRIRALFRIGPTRWMPVNYAVAFVGLGALHAGLLGAWIESGSSASTALDAVVGLGVTVPAIAWAGAVWGLPELGYRWDAAHGGHRTKALLAVGAIWYALLTTLPGVVVSILAAFPA